VDRGEVYPSFAFSSFEICLLTNNRPLLALAMRVRSDRRGPIWLRSYARRHCFSCPKEILFKIIQNIGLDNINEDIKAVTRFAMASKQSLTNVEAAVGSTSKELCSLEKRFGIPCFTPDSIAHALTQRDYLKERFHDITSESTAPNLAYLRLDGSLSWLPPLDPVNKAEMGPHHRGPAIRSKALGKLIAEAERLHLRLAASFLTLVRSIDLQYRIPSSCAAYFEVGSHFVKCPPSMDRNAGGYVIKFLQDQQGCWYASLYLDPMGQHCVFFSALNPHECAEEEDEDEDEDDDVVPMDAFAKDAVLKAMDFEEFLYHTWMDELCYFTLPRADE